MSIKRSPRGVFQRRNAEKRLERERFASDIASGRVDPKKARTDAAFIKHPERARVIRDWDGSRWYDD